LVHRDGAWAPETIGGGAEILNDLDDVNTPSGSATDGQVLTHRGGVWVPEDASGGAEQLNDLSDVDAAEPDSNDVLTFNGSNWVPQPLPEGVSGNFVQAPAGEYAIVAAGYFGPNGDPVDGQPVYNDLKAFRQSEGAYILTFPLYPRLRARAEEITIIVKGTIVDPTLPSIIEEDPFNLELRADMPATFQVVSLDAKGQDGQSGILIWITQEVLRFAQLLKYVNSREFPEEFNVLHFTPTDRSFMVEISAYGKLSQGETPPVERVNINTATEEELRTLPRIGPALSRRILEVREAMGGFTSIGDLREVSGIDDFLVSRLAHLITL
jgi:competence ComEA-like helix-hairpin-helix protein